MKKLSLLLMAIAVTALAIFVIKTQFIDDSKDKEHYLFSITAPTSTIEKLANQEDVYQLTLKVVNPQVTFFADRPIRKSGIIHIRHFIKEWRNGANHFEDDAPNADLVLTPTQKNSRQISIPVTLMSMMHDDKKQSIIYTFKPLPQEVSSKKFLEIKQFGHTGVFIEDGKCVLEGHTD